MDDKAFPGIAFSYRKPRFYESNRSIYKEKYPLNEANKNGKIWYTWICLNYNIVKSHAFLKTFLDPQNQILSEYINLLNQPKGNLKIEVGIQLFFHTRVFICVKNDAGTFRP